MKFIYALLFVAMIAIAFQPKDSIVSAASVCCGDPSPEPCPNCSR